MRRIEAPEMHAKCTRALICAARAFYRRLGAAAGRSHCSEFAGVGVWRVRDISYFTIQRFAKITPGVIFQSENKEQRHYEQNGVGVWGVNGEK